MIQVEHLTKYYGNKAAIKYLTLFNIKADISDGGCIAVILG